LAWLEWLEHARTDGRELRRRGAHDYRDDVPAVRRLVLDQPTRPIDVEVDAIAPHPKLQLSRHARAHLAPEPARRNEEDVWALPCDHRAQRAAPDLRVVGREALVLGHDDALGSVPSHLFENGREVGAEHERDVLAAELAGQLAAFPEQL